MKLLNNFLKLLIILFSITNSIYSQTLVVKGKVSSAIRYSIKDALVTFIDKLDTTKQYSALTDNSGNYQISILTSVETENNYLPKNFNLGQNYPNPFSNTTAIPYGLNKESNVTITIYDILGREIRKINAGFQTAGNYNILWDGRNNLGVKVANGIYFYKLEAGGESLVKKMILSQSGSNLIPLFSAPLPKINLVQNNKLYRVRIQNTKTTTPVILPVEIDNVTIQRDTTINFSVTYLSTTDIDTKIDHQIIRGFGAANIVQWRPDMTDSEIETAFGMGEGQLGFTILRIRIQPDPNLWSTNVPTAKKAFEKGATIIASPWSPPASMKTNNNIVGGSLREDAYEQYAYHLRDFVNYMKNQGVPIYAVSVQNEPDISVTYESSDWTPEQMIKFLRYYAPLIGTKVMAPESYQFRRQMSDPILNDSLASKNLDIVAGHIYGGGLAPYPLAESKGKEIWMTEHLTGSDERTNPTSWQLAFPVAQEMVDVMQAGMSAYVWWYIVRFYGPISDGEYNSGRKGDVTKKGYVMSQFAKFVRPGYYRVESSVNPALTKIDAVAFRDSSSSKFVIVAINANSTETECVFRLQNNSANYFTPYTTSETKNCQKGDKISVVDDSFRFKMEPMSITTFVSE